MVTQNDSRTYIKPSFIITIALLLIAVFTALYINGNDAYNECVKSGNNQTVCETLKN